MKLNINSFGWGLPTHDVKEDAVKKDVDSKVVTAQLDGLRDSVNGITAALDSLPARIVAEIQVNDPKQELPLTHPLRLDFDAAISRLTDTQARLAATAATLDTTTAKLYTAEDQLRTTEARLDEKEEDYIDLQYVNHNITSMLDQTKEEYLSLLHENQCLRNELDALKNKASSDVADDDTPSEASISETSPPSLSASPPVPAPTLEEHVLLRDYARLHYDISQIALHPALSIRQKTLGPNSPEKASFYDPATWASLSPAARDLRIRGGIFDLVAKHLLLGSSFCGDLVLDWSLHRASIERLASFQKLMIRDAGISPEKIQAWHRAWLLDLDGNIFNRESTGKVFVTDAIMDLLRPVLSPSCTEQDELSLSQAVTQLCERAHDVGSLMLEGGFALTSPEVGKDVSPTNVIIAGFEGPALEVGDAGEVLFILFAGMVRRPGADGRVRWLKKAEVVVGAKKMAAAADMEAATLVSSS